jgi:hypothetical protein
VEVKSVKNEYQSEYGKGNEETDSVDKQIMEEIKVIEARAHGEIKCVCVCVCASPGFG